MEGFQFLAEKTQRLTNGILLTLVANTQSTF
jgi:hypothetical protein